MNTNVNKIAVIGGCGFLGSRLSKQLDESSYDYVTADINPTSKGSIKVDVENIDSICKLSNVDCFINLAALHRDDIRPLTRYDDVNIKGAINVCNAARKLNVNKIIFTSSVAIYGFAPIDTDETGSPNYFNDYGRTKYLAEQIYIDWQKEDLENRTLVIVRPTVIFGEGNRGNVYNLLKQIASKKFAMIGDGKNKKSMAYVENVAAFLEYSLSFKEGISIYNYVDKPDLDMNALVSIARKQLFEKNNVGLRLPAFVGTVIGLLADLVIYTTGKTLPVSSIRFKKFFGTTQFASSVFTKTNFVPPVSIEEGLQRTIRYEFLEDNSDNITFKTE
tara:strand:- start:34 stop:1029 length:996 start_codon:yes stop_codon:yes gene_type:complete